MVAIGVTEVVIGVALLYLTLRGYSRDVFDVLFGPDHKSHQVHGVNAAAPPTVAP